MSFKNFSPLTDLENLNITLNNYGVAVIPNVFTPDECELVKLTTFNNLAQNKDVKGPNDYDKINIMGGGIIHDGIALSKEILDMKSDERVEKIFKTIWNNQEVTMSLDGINIIPPPARLNPASNLSYKLNNPAGFHTDQSSFKREKCCIQAFINLENTEDGDGCLSVLRYSHNFHAIFFQHFKIDVQNDLFVLKPNHYDWFISNGCDWVKILAPKGSMVFWDSRTIHKATAPMFNRPNPDRWRFVIYVCYTPAYLQTEEDTRKKKEAYIYNLCTAHWPYNVRIFYFKNNDSTMNKLKDLTARHKKCLGFLE